MVTIDVQLQVTLEHRKAMSACCSAPLSLAPAAAAALEAAGPGTTLAETGLEDHEHFTCSACSAPTTRVLGDPVTVVANA